MPFVPYPLPPHDPALDRVTAVLDPILTTLGFAAGQVGASGERGQVIFCRASLTAPRADASISLATWKQCRNGA